MKLSDAVPVPDDALAAIVERHRLEFENVRVEPMPAAGIINTVYALGARYVLRVPRNHPAHVAQAVREAAAIPLAVEAGVRTPRLVAFDDARDLLPVPYLVVERVSGADLESLNLSPPDPRDAWRELGRDLARLHLLPDPALRDGDNAWGEHRVATSADDPGGHATRGRSGIVMG